MNEIGIKKWDITSSELFGEDILQILNDIQVIVGILFRKYGGVWYVTPRISIISYTPEQNK